MELHTWSFSCKKDKMYDKALNKINAVQTKVTLM